MKVEFKPMPAVPFSEMGRRRKVLTKKYPPPPKAEAEELAIVGGGPSVQLHVKEIRKHEAIWAINGAWRWCEGKKIGCVGFTLDSAFDDPCPVTYFGDGCDPARVEACQKPFVIPLNDVVRGTTTATAAPIVAMQLGYKRVYFYGCEGSFLTEENTHSFKSAPGNLVWVTCGGKEFISNPQMIMQCEALATFMRVAPNLFINRSGGLLAAMIDDPEYDVSAVSRTIYQAMLDDPANDREALLSIDGAMHR